MILDNLRKAGVQNTVKNERLVFDRLEPLAGTWLQASGSYTDADGKSRRVAVSIGPEHGTVGPNQVKEAAKEAVLDVYDPTTGAIRSHSTDDIAWWFIDTNYDGESFFVRHAYFTGADEPYEKLKRALKAEIDEAAWSTLYSTVSRPFAQPETGKIAVKVIDHYGDEVLKVFDV